MPRDGLGGEQVEGRRAVLELLRAGRRPVRTVSVSRSARDDATLEEIRARAGDALRVVGADRLDAIARSDAPQGVVATAAPLPSADLDELLAAVDAFLVALDGISDPRNLGAVARVAETAGATGLIVPRHRSAHVTPAVAKAAAGAIEHVPIALVAGIPNALERARSAAVW
jgi:23S rRNA (guanosine2251-2'-O)-methyltransferase